MLDLMTCPLTFFAKEFWCRNSGARQLAVRQPWIRTSALYSAVNSATKSLLYVANRLYSCDRLRDRPRPRLAASAARLPLLDEDDEEGKAFRILRCFHAAVSMGEAVDPRRR